MIRLVLLTLLVLPLGCKRDPIRDLVEKDTSGSSLAIGACLDSLRAAPTGPCERVAARAADNVIAAESPNRLQCGDALEIADRFARDKLGALAMKCCHGVLATEVEAICKRLAHSPQ